jgi:hypothetical protein
MTGQLRTTLHIRADQLDAWDADLGAIVDQGERRVRRRRAALAGGMAAVLVVAGGIATLAGGAHRTTPQPADDNAKPLTYAVGSVIHTGDSQIDVGVPIRSMVVLDDGFVYAGPDQTVYFWQDGGAHALGHVADASTRLFSSDDGVNALWLDCRHRIDWWPGYLDRILTFHGHTVEAVSAGHLWWSDGGRTSTAELPPLTTHATWPDDGLGRQPIVKDAAGDRILVDVGGGLAVVRAHLLPRPHDPGWADFRPGTDLSGVTPQITGVSRGDLAPDGQHWFTSDGGRFAVYDSTTAQEQDPAHPGFDTLVPAQWLGDDTIAAVGSRSSDPGGPVSLLTCRVSTNQCAVAVPDVGTSDDVVLANGLPSTRST